MKYFITTTAAFVFTAVNALAHGGHGVIDSASIMHYLGEIAHIAPALVAGAAVYLIVRLRRTAKQ